MPKPDKFVIPPEAGYPGLPIDDNEPEYEKSKTYFKEVIQPRVEFEPPSDEVKTASLKTPFTSQPLPPRGAIRLE